MKKIVILIAIFVFGCYAGNDGCKWFDYMEKGMISPVNDNSDIIQKAAIENQDGHCSSSERFGGKRYGCKWYDYIERGMLSPVNDNSDIIRMASIENQDGHCSSSKSDKNVNKRK